jgi:hypothetical protein
LLHDYSPRRFAARPANGRRRALHRDAVGSDQPPARRRCCEGVSETNLHHVLNATFVCVALICGEYQVADRPDWSAIPSAKVSYKRRKVYAAITAIGGANQMSKKTKEVRKTAKKAKGSKEGPRDDKEVGVTKCAENAPNGPRAAREMAFAFTFNSAMSVSCADSSCYPLWPTRKAAPCSFIPFRR